MTFHPVTAENWSDFSKLFKAHGNPNYCWCMTWRMSNSKFRDCDSRDRREALKQKILKGTPVGILGYIDEEPIGWCSVAPRETYGRLVRSRTIKKIDNKGTWSVVCFFIKPDFQQRGYTLKFLKRAVDYARSKGAEVVEGYPVEPRKDKDENLDYDVSYRFMGYLSTFQKAGFVDVTPQDSTRKIMRYLIAK